MSPDSPSQSTSRPAEAPALEVQIHPSDIRRGVHYFFLSRRQLVTWGVALGLAALVLLVGVGAAPWVAARALKRAEYESLIAERALLGGRLQALTDELARLHGDAGELRLEMRQIYLAYGLSSRESVGQGGYPFLQAAAPDSIYAAVIQRGSGLESGVREELRVLDTFLEEVQRFEEEHQDRVRTTPSVSPLRGPDFVLTSPFGNRRNPFTKELDFHAGIDLAAPVGTPVHAPADGTVVYAGRYPLRQSVGWWRYGNLVAIRHGDRFITLYGHCDELRPRPGDQVRQGDVIATVGNSGWSTSPHLHYEVRSRHEGGEYRPVDPRIYILDHQWRDEERLLIRGRQAPDPGDFEPLPGIIGR